MLKNTVCLSLIVFALILTAIVSTANAQTAGKVGLIDTDEFYDESAGITKIINGYRALEAEFRASRTEIENGIKRLDTLKAELQALQRRAADTSNKVPIDDASVQAKVDEFERLQRDIKFKQEDGKARYSKREDAVIGVIINDVGKALSEYAKQKGYVMVLDVGKLYQQRSILYWDESQDVTRDFIQYYNSRTAAAK